jgi:hypothetical protein
VVASSGVTARRMEWGSEWMIYKVVAGEGGGERFFVSEIFTAAAVNEERSGEGKEGKQGFCALLPGQLLSSPHSMKSGSLARYSPKGCIIGEAST